MTAWGLQAQYWVLGFMAVAADQLWRMLVIHFRTFCVFI
jgi:hypothetical protein